MNICISAGEVSGDIVGARLAEAIRRQCPDARIFGLGGPRMAAAGVQVDFYTNHLGCIGLIEPLFLIPAFFKAFAAICKQVDRQKPEVAVLIGQDVAHLILASWLRRKRIRTICYLPPQIWLWRRFAGSIARRYDHILSSFPEEDDAYRRAGGRSVYVGHYLRDLVCPPSTKSKEAARAAFNLPTGGPVVGLLPGSRDQELRNLSPILLDAAVKLLRRDGSVHFLLPLAESRYRAPLEKEIRTRGLAERVVLAESSHDAMRACDIALIASGTAALEAALMELPMVIFYRVSELSMIGIRALLACGVISGNSIGLPNLLAGKTIVPELHQRQASAERLFSEAWGLLTDPQKQSAMIRGLNGATASLGVNSIEKAAGFIVAQAALSGVAD